MNKDYSNIDYLKPTREYSCVRYSHIVRGANHYQFYFDFEKITNYNKEKIIKWAQMQKKSIEQDAYKIIISPLQLSNASFLKIIVDNTFDSNFHLLHIDMFKTGKEIILSKFNYIIEEIKKIIEQQGKIHFYYVDDSICTGNSIARAYKFITMLYRHALNFSDKTVEKIKFKKVFLLVNRSSYETASMWVDKAASDWLGVINLLVPSYNTYANYCPGCKVRDRQELLKKRSATNELAKYFAEQMDKQVARKPEEYDEWLNNEIIKKSSIFTWFRLWFNYQDQVSDDFHSKIKQYICELKDNQTVCFKDILDKNMDINLKEKVLKEVNYMIAEEGFRRLKSMNNAYRELWYDGELLNIFDKLRNSNKNEYQQNYQAYLVMLEDKIVALLAETLKLESSHYECIMEFISYIKVISRDYLAKNHYIKTVILNVIIKLFKILMNSKDSKDIDALYASENLKNNWEKIKNYFQLNSKVPLALRYRIYKIIIHRIALLRSDYIIYFKTFLTIFQAYEYMIKANKNETNPFLRTPPYEVLMNDYIAAIKTATMEENNDGMCFKLLELCRSIKVYSCKFTAGKEQNAMLREIYFKLYIENSRVIYDFMEELSHKTSNLYQTIDLQWKYQGYVGDKGLKNYVNIQEEQKKKLEPIITESLNGELYQNPISSSLRFYLKVFDKYLRTANGKSSQINQNNNTDITNCVNSVNNISGLLNYFNILQYLTEKQYKEHRHINYDKMPYIFEDLCFTLNRLANCKDSYIIYKKSGEASQLVARSGYLMITNDTLEAFSPITIGSEQFDKLILCGEKQLDVTLSCISRFDDAKLIKACRAKKDNENLEYFLVIRIPIDWSDENRLKYNFSKDKSERDFYIILRFDSTSHADSNNPYFYIDILYQIFFLRNRLWETLKEFGAGLLNFRYYCNYIRSVNSKFQSIKLIHISDLHIDLKYNTLVDKITSDLNSEKYQNSDLLMITGDIINYFTEAYAAQKAYKAAAEVIFNIARQLWVVTINEIQYLPHDWKRRILITTGNHDYATMGGVKVTTGARQTRIGLPALSVGGTMSRYTYFIEFLCDFLDAPVKSMIKFDLNEIREYNNLGSGIVVGVFNTVAEANHWQNNKVSLNQKIIKSLIANSNWRKKDYFHIALMHHSPNYKIDYISDQYSFQSIRTLPDSIRITGEKAIKAFINVIHPPKCNARKNKFLKAMQDLNEAINSLKESPNELMHSDFFQDMQKLYNYYQNALEQPKEWYYHFAAKNRALCSNMKEDNINFKNNCLDIFNGIDSKQIVVLAGHIHKFNHTDAKYNIPECYIANKYGSEKSVLVYELNEEGLKEV